MFNESSCGHRYDAIFLFLSLSWKFKDIVTFSCVSEVMSHLFIHLLLSIYDFIVCVQEDSEKTGKVTSVGMYFLHFQVYRMDSTVNAVCKLSFILYIFFSAGCLASCCGKK